MVVGILLKIDYFCLLSEYYAKEVIGLCIDFLFLHALYFNIAGTMFYLH